MRIGIVAKVFETTFGITLPYGEYFQRYGDVITLSPDQFDAVDLVVLPGGADVDPRRYGESPRFFTNKPDPFLERFDLKTLPKYIEKGVPVFGICRGIQTLNVHFGGTLHQHLFSHNYSDTRDERVHAIFPAEDKAKKRKVNSLHHQSVKKLGQGLVVTHYSDDMVVEAIEHESLRVSAVQWHPEEIYDITAKEILEKLLNKQ